MGKNMRKNIEKNNQGKTGKKLSKTVLAAALFTVMSAALAWGQVEDLYGTPDKAPVYHSVQELRAAADTLMSGWTGAITGLEYEEKENTTTVEFRYLDGEAPGQMKINLFCGEDGASGYFTYKCYNREDYNTAIAEEGIRFAATLICGEPGGVPEMVARETAEELKGKPEDGYYYNGYRRVNGIDCNYNIFGYRTSDEYYGGEIELTMEFNPHQMNADMYKSGTDDKVLTVKEMKNLTVSYNIFVNDWHKVHGTLGELKRQPDGYYSGTLKDGEDQLLVEIDRINPLEELKQASVFYIRKEHESYLSSPWQEYTINLCE